MPETTTEEAGSAYLDTVALLQEEVARLEDELRRRPGPEFEALAAPDGLPADENVEARVAELTALLAERDEAIGLLCDEIAALEESGAARAAEWEQMDQWVRELERRIDHDGPAAPAYEESARQAEALRAELADRERSWRQDSARMEREIIELRSRLSEPADDPGHEARASLEVENHRLRDECRRLTVLEGLAAESEGLRQRSQDLAEQLSQARLALDQAEGEIRRVRIDRDAELAALRASLASARAGRPAELSIDDRIAALRDHLREVHEREQREREDRQLSRRLARLWRRTAPGG